jgi:LAS superfamily LD-carboxypeptidase LdcB
MLGDEVDYGTAASRQSQSSGIRTDGRTIIIQELSELRNVETHQQGYQADSSMDDDSSEESFTTTTAQGKQNSQNSRLLHLPMRPSGTRQRG